MYKASQAKSIILSKEEVVSKLGKFAETSIHFAENEGGEYIGYLEVFHELHCTVNALDLF